MRPSPTSLAPVATLLAPESTELLRPLTYADESQLSDAGSNDALHDDFLGALGGLARNSRLRKTLEGDEASDEGVKSDLLDHRLIVPGRVRGGSASLRRDQQPARFSRRGSGLPIAAKGSRRQAWISWLMRRSCLRSWLCQWR